MSGDTTGEERRSRRDLYVALEIEPPRESSCPLGGFDGEVVEIRQHLTDEECQTDTAVHRGDCDNEPGGESMEIFHTTSSLDTACPCEVFGRFDCVPRIVDADDDRIVVETYLPDRSRLDDLVSELKCVADGLALRKLTRVDARPAESGGRTVTLDLQEVTEKQREAVVAAVAAGYYASPRETSLGELASEFEVSKSALSQRLKSVEAKLATGAFAGASTAQ